MTSGMNGLVIMGIGETWYLYCRTSGKKRFGRVGRNMSFDSKVEAEMVMQRYRETYPNQEFEVREVLR